MLKVEGSSVFLEIYSQRKRILRILFILSLRERSVQSTDNDDSLTMVQVSVKLPEPPFFRLEPESLQRGVSGSTHRNSIKIGQLHY